MKSTLTLLISVMLCTSLYAQKKGYGEIQIGKSLKAIRALNKYKLFADTSKQNTWVVGNDSLRIFMTDIARLEIRVDKKEIIQTVTAYTADTIFTSYKDWLSSLKYMLNAINADVGKINSDDLSRPSNADFSFAWSFNDTKTALAIKVPKADRSLKWYKGNYTLIWFEDKNNMAGYRY
jgi:hypothetical protein